jgi:DNA-binding PadR family transcriptional regulator
MPKAADHELSPGDWAVLGLLVSSPAHGFALAKELSANGRWGQVWTVPRPLVYRALSTLEARGLISIDRSEDSRLGPPRAVYRATRSGAAAFLTWLNTPVAHYRDTRSQLLLKLGFLWIRGESAEPLLSQQLAVFEPMQQGLRDKLSNVDGFDRTLALWRLESAQALIRFIETLRSEDRSAGPGPRAGASGGAKHPT